jgi:hypothetical protein
VEKGMTDRAYEEFIRDFGEEIATRDLFGPTAVLKFDSNGFSTTVRSVANIYGKQLLHAETEFRSRDKFAISVWRKGDPVRSLIRNWIIGRTFLCKTKFA